MRKNSKSKGNNNAPRKKIDPTVLVAIIGVIGTLLTAILASPVLIALIPKPNPPIIAPTETAMLPSPIIINIASPTIIPSTPTLPPTLVGQEWKSIMNLRFASIPNCGASQQLLPSNIDPVKNFDVAKGQIAQAIQSGEYLNWPIVGNANILLDILSLATNQEAIKISNKLHVDVISQNQGNLPNSVNVLDTSACGGEGQIRGFSVIGLSNDFQTYSLDSIFSEFEFFQLPPGEIESFSLPLECRAIGLYSVEVNVSYNYSNYSGFTDSDQNFEFLCPQVFTVWYFSPLIEQFYSSTTYEWSGSGYNEVP